MPIPLKTTLTPISSTFRGVQNSSFGVNVNGIHVMTWGVTDTSHPDAPMFHGRAEFRPDVFYVLQTNGWLPEVIDGVVTPATEFPFSLLKTATDSAIKDMFGPTDSLDISRQSDGTATVTQNGKVLFEFLDPLEFGSLHCLAGDLPVVPAGGLVFSMSSGNDYSWKEWHEGEGGYDVETFAPFEVEQVIPFAYRALINGWIS